MIDLNDLKQIRSVNILSFCTIYEQKTLLNKHCFFKEISIMEANNKNT